MMKQTILRIISLALVLVMLASFAVACNNEEPDKIPNNKGDETGESGDSSLGGKDNEPVGSGDSSGDKDDPVDPSDDDPVKVLDGIPDMDMQGYTFNTLCRSSVTFLREAYADNGTGDQISQAVYDRNSYIEDRYNCLLASSPVGEEPESTLTNTFNMAISVGDCPYQLALGHMIYASQECLNGTMLNVKSLPYIDTSKSYWNQSMNEQATINDKLYFTVNEYCTSSVYYTYIMIFNMEACEEREIDVYGMVEDGTWTIDNMWKIVSKSYEDDGDNVIEFEDDKFGFITHRNTAITNWAFALDVPMCDPPSSGKTEFYFGNERSVSSAEKLYDLFHESSNGTFMLAADELSDSYNPLNADMQITSRFGAGGSVFAATKVYALENLRNTNIRYGIVSYPKFDETQEKYHSHPDGKSSFLFVPYTLPESEYEYVGALIESLAAATAVEVMPVIQKAALLGRYSEDSQAYKVLSEVLEGRTYSFVYLNESAFKGRPFSIFKKMMLAKSDNLDDYWKGYSRTAPRELQNIIKKYAALG